MEMEIGIGIAMRNEGSIPMDEMDERWKKEKKERKEKAFVDI
jgi:hypothetical protein